jgi:hypothetical protein
MTTRLRLGIAFLVAAAFVAGGLWIAREVSIDRCLDRGGAWDYEQARCVPALNSHGQNSSKS